MGEDIRRFNGGGAFQVTPMEKFAEFGQERVRETPISEAAFIGASITAAITGLKPVVELMFVDFAGVCFDQIYNNAGKMRYMLGSQVKVPLVIRTTMGVGLSLGATHSQTLYSLFAHCPGLKIVAPSTPYDAKGLLKHAIRNNEDPVMFFEHRNLYSTIGPVPLTDYTIPFGVAEIRREGSDVTIVATAAMVKKSLAAAKELEIDNISAEVIDTRSLVPLDKQMIKKSVEKTSRLVIVDEDYGRCGIASEIAATICEESFEYLRAPVKRVVTPTIPIPFNPKLEDALIPNEKRIISAVKEIVR
jgi:pyruvate/2-oxoglutarate/acetoin dehydrogenase E1 component